MKATNTGFFNKFIDILNYNYGLFCLALFISMIILLYLVTLVGAAQPETGPGGKDYYYKVSKTKYGTGSEGFYIFEPKKPMPNIAPIIVFLHGFTATNPRLYEKWINHLVKRGNIVIYPIYQRTPISISQQIKFPTNALIATKKAIDELLNNLDNHPMPDLNCFITVGHSMGGTISADIAAKVTEWQLPQVKAIFAIMPGKYNMPPLYDLSNIPSNTYLISLVGDADFLAGDRDAKRIFNNTIQIPLQNKDYIIMQSDKLLRASHMAPLTIGTANTLDYYGFWKLLDGLINCVRYNTDCEYCLGDTPEQRYMGGAKELIIQDYSLR